MTNFSKYISVCTFCIIIASSSLAQTTSTAAGAVRYVDKLMSEKVYKDRPSTAVVDMVMMHFTSTVTSTPDDPYNVDRMKKVFEEYGVSAHYLVDRDGTVYRLVPEEKQAFHAGRGQLPFEPNRRNVLNATSIGIETFAVSSKKDMKMFMSEEKYDDFAAKHPDKIGYTPAQYEAIKNLLADIQKRNPAVKLDRYHVVGHEEYASTRRSDPGELFDWTKIGLTKYRQ